MGEKKNHDLCHASLVWPLREENIICKTNANFSPWSQKLHNMQQNAKCIIVIVRAILHTRMKKKSMANISYKVNFKFVKSYKLQNKDVFQNVKA